MNLISPLRWSLVSYLPVTAAFSMDSTNVATSPYRPPLQSTIVDFPNKDRIIDLKLLPFSCLRRWSMICNDKAGMNTVDGTAHETSTALVHALITYGVAIIEIGDCIKEDQLPNIPANAFASARFVMDQIQHPDVSVVCPFVPSDDTVDSAHAYGYHRTGGMISKRYNQFREGFVFSDSIRSFDVALTPKPLDDTSAGSNYVPTTFQHDCHAMFTLLHDIADTCLMHVANHFQLPNDWFQQQYGPTVDHSQWHVKRYVMEKSAKLNDEGVLLPTHSDPSLVSIVMLDQPDIQPGAMGLQFLRCDRSSTNNNNPPNTEQSINPEWIEVPWSGHKVAIVFVGSVLQYATNGYFMASKHRVVQKKHPNAPPRMAATLFCRPAPSACLVAPPHCKSEMVRKGSQKVNQKPILFSEWMKKTAKNYEKSAMAKRSTISNIAQAGT
jgi:isopenicillin N synthase-like dioxygenase